MVILGEGNVKSRERSGRTLSVGLELLSFRNGGLAGLNNALLHVLVNDQSVLLLRHTNDSNHSFSNSLFLSDKLLFALCKERIWVHHCSRGIAKLRGRGAQLLGRQR